MNKKRVLFSTKWIAYTALLTAMVVAMGYVPGIPVLTGKIYWCDFAIFTAAYLTDPISAMIVGGIGTTFFDLFGINGTAYNAIPSLLIHGLQGFTAGLIFQVLKKFFNKKGSYKRETVIAVISSILPAIIVILGYFIKRITWEAKPAEVALLKMPANVLQEVIGIGVAIAICYGAGLKKRLIKAHLLPDFSKEVLNKSTVATAEAATENTEGAEIEAKTAVEAAVSDDTPPTEE
ncbi:MAG: ECF transporter S component [Candidatus Coproplasma sp.]